MIKLYDGYQAKKANFETLDVGGYILRILNAKVEKKPASEWLVFSFDIAEGEHKDFYNKRYKEKTNEDKKWEVLSGCESQTPTVNILADRKPTLKMLWLALKKATTDTVLTARKPT